ncbi:MAG: DUF4294 domain-containing protein [Bacteroidia bacterium]|nr:MAG: DUF4294 domain-containing protein [Bacteroidia bacterium]
MKYILTILFALFFVQYASTQDTVTRMVDSLPVKLYLLENVTRDGETLPEIAIDEVEVKRKMGLGERFQWWRHRRLVFNVKKVYPYCVVVRESLTEVNDTLMKITDEKERKRFLNDFEKRVFKDYEDDMRKMTITQGRILIKLVDRETQNSSYDLIHDYRGPVTALFWQGIARIFGTNLKDKYDPEGEDYLIERVVTEIEAGRI